MLSKTEELDYLTDLLLAASQWQCSENEPLSPLHLEVKDRLRRLTGQETINVVGVPSDKVNGREQSVTMPSATAPAPSTRKRKKAPSDYLIRVKVDGKFKRFPREMCDKVPCVHSTTGYKWILKSQPAGNGVVSNP